MSKKSRMRAAKRASMQAALFPVELLELQKAQIHTSVQEQYTLAMITSAVMLLAIVACVLAARKNTEMLYVTIFPTICLVLPTIYFAEAVRMQRIARLLDGITDTASETVSFRCRRIRILEKQLTRFSSCLFGVILHAEDGRVFYYISPDRLGLSFPSSAKDIRTRLVGNELTPICYCGTSIIKELEPTQSTIPSPEQKGHRS